MIETILAVLLIVILPARALYRSLRGGKAPVSRPRRYLVSCAIIVGLLVLLGYAWWHAARAPALLGLGLPLSEGGMIGLAIAVAFFLVLAVVEAVMQHKGRAANEAKARKKLAGNAMLPRNRRELMLFLGFALLAGCGWELLYRGFLMWFLIPHVGAIGAVCIAALAYGVSHGYKNRMQFLGSVAAAFAFTLAFVLTGSLWWLMLIHTVAAVVGGFGSYRLASRMGAEPSFDAAEAASP